MTIAFLYVSPWCVVQEIAASSLQKRSRLDSISVSVRYGQAIAGTFSFPLWNTETMIADPYSVSQETRICCWVVDIARSSSLTVPVSYGKVDIYVDERDAEESWSTDILKAFHFRAYTIFKPEFSVWFKSTLMLIFLSSKYIKQCYHIFHNNDIVADTKSQLYCALTW